MESYLELPQTDSQPDNFNNNSNDELQEEEVVDVDKLLEELQKIDDLEQLDAIENMLLSKKKSKAEDLKQIFEINDGLKSDINREKCFIKELDQLHTSEHEKTEDLMENIQLKQKEIIELEDRQVGDIELFELQVSEVAKELVTAPKKYENNVLEGKIQELVMASLEMKNELNREIENVIVAQEAFEKPTEMESIDLPLNVFDCGIGTITSFNKDLAQKLDILLKEADKLRLNRMTANFTRQSSLNNR